MRRKNDGFKKFKRLLRMDMDDYRKKMTELSAEEMEAYEKEMWNAPSMPIPDRDVEEALDSFRMRIGRMHRRVVFRLVAAAAAVAAVFLGIGLWAGAKAGAETAESVKWCEVFSQNGKMETLTLPDGSVVTMGGGSRLMYPESFVGRERDVYFSGEGLFSVSRNAAKPFVVNIDGTKVKVTGTRFNVKAYPEDRQQTITLMEGSVDVSFGGKDDAPLHLAAGKAAFCDLGTGEISLYDIDESRYPAWYKGEFDAYHSSFRQIARDLERIYGVKIIFRNAKLENTMFYISIVHAESADMILEALSNSTPFRIRREGDVIYLD